MLLVYYNDNYQVFYEVYKIFYDYEKYVGYKNSYNHEIVQILFIHNNELHSIHNSNDYHQILLNDRRKKRNTFIKRLIRFLNKFEKE